MKRLWTDSPPPCAANTRPNSTRSARRATRRRSGRPVGPADGPVLDSSPRASACRSSASSALQKYGLECVGEVGDDFDPEVMEVVEVVRDSDVPNNEVLRSFAPAICAKGGCFVMLKVRVAKENPVPTQESDGDS